MKQRVRRWKAMMMAVMLVFSIILPAKTVRAADPTTTIQVTGIEEGCNVYAYAVAIDAVDANGNHYWKYNPEGNVESRVKDGKVDTDDLVYFYMNHSIFICNRCYSSTAVLIIYCNHITTIRIFFDLFICRDYI